MGPVMGGVLAAALYDYIYCPDKELKKHMKEKLSMAPYASTKYTEAEDSRYPRDLDELVIKPGPFHMIDVAERKDRDPSREVLSSV